MSFSPSSARTSRGRRHRPAVERDAGGVGHPRQPVERAHRQARLDETGGPDRGEDGTAGGREVGPVAVSGVGELEEHVAVGDPGAAFEGRSDVDRGAER